MGLFSRRGNDEPNESVPSQVAEAAGPVDEDGIPLSFKLRAKELGAEEGFDFITSWRAGKDK